MNDVETEWGNSVLEAALVELNALGTLLDAAKYVGVEYGFASDAYSILASRAGEMRSDLRPRV